jgi:uncharacterized protein (TIGR00369 family)
VVGFDVNQTFATSRVERMGQHISAAARAEADAAASVDEIDGLEFLNRIRAGRIPPPPMVVLLGFDIVEIERGRVVFGAIPTRAHYNPAGAVHGGYAATMLDSAMTCAVQSTLAPGLACTTVDLNIHYTRSANEGTGLLRAEGRIVHAGRQIATAEGRVTDPEGRVIAHATTSCLIFPARPAKA